MGAGADGAGRGCPEEGGVVSLRVGPVGGEGGQDGVEGGHGGGVGQGGGLGGGQGQGGWVEAGREERVAEVGQHRVGSRWHLAPGGDERRKADSSTGGERAGLQGTVGQQGAGDLAGHQRTPAALEGLPDAGRPQVAEGGERSSNGRGQSPGWASTEADRARDSVRTVGMAVRSDLLLFSPLGPSVLEPNLKEGEFYISDGRDNFSRLGLTDMLSSLAPVNI